MVLTSYVKKYIIMRKCALFYSSSQLPSDSQQILSLQIGQFRLIRFEAHLIQIGCLQFLIVPDVTSRQTQHSSSKLMLGDFKQS